jgi:Low-density lipoprotein receptor repeat class B
VAGVAVDAAQVYWTNFGADSIGRANLDGSGAVQAFIGSVDDPLGIAVDGAHVYWTNLSTGGIGAQTSTARVWTPDSSIKRGRTPSPSGPQERSGT